uniref:SCP domain-containing protein n=1 Tax=Steinernema glaseri TaxID=37863 RepID=A0A1I7YT89_9BILA
MCTEKRNVNPSNFRSNHSLQRISFQWNQPFNPGAVEEAALQWLIQTRYRCFNNERLLLESHDSRHFDRGRAV